MANLSLFYREGVVAYLRGRKEEDNPYDEGTDLHRWWFKGFYDTQEDHESKDG